jgi:hypothetical protein
MVSLTTARVIRDSGMVQKRTVPAGHNLEERAMVVERPRSGV